jgi:hypothetical protein
MPPPPPPKPAAPLKREQAPAKKVVAIEPKPQKTYTVFVSQAKLPADGQQLLDAYNTDVTAIQNEIAAKVEARRQAAIKALEALQDQYTKQGKLDEAVAIRDYLRAGGPHANNRFLYSPANKGGK